MSKFPNANLAVLAAGGTALLLGVAYGVSTTGYGNDRIETLQASLDETRATASQRSDAVGDLETALGALQASTDEQIAALRAEAEQQANTAQRQVAALQTQLQSAQSAAAMPPVQPKLAQDVAEPGQPLDLGRAALPQEVAAWDVDVLPDGRGLPVGSGDVLTGDEVFSEKCASCHGDFAEGRDNWPVLAGGFDTLADRDPVKTVGSYWPYLSTVWDYVHRSMPFGNAGSLSDDEVYAITAYILYSNDLVEEDFTLDQDTFADISMPNRDGFVPDNRPETEYTQWRDAPCMTDCKSGPAQITRRSTDVGVTPADDGSMVESFMEQQLAALGGVEWGKERVAGSVHMGDNPEVDEEPVTQTTIDTPPATAEQASAPDPAQLATGEKVFRRCKSCHAVGDGAKNKTGPHLNDVFGRTIGGIDGFKYSPAFQAASQAGQIWDADSLAAFLGSPKTYLEGTKMTFAGLRSDADIAGVIAYLTTYSTPAVASGFSVDAEVLALAGDPEYGAYLSSECTTCHQADGSSDGIPPIVGLGRNAFVTAMHAYRAGVREHQVMQMITGRLSDDEIAALAAYFEDLND